ncbi:class I SAM-dependent methyltransferase [Nocardia grenadensis]|uniref:class I SAM-dependent methyltransferase n=1 Tax=Nocardia grenadensis TaxID=931537 RepID=UPI003D746E65
MTSEQQVRTPMFVDEPETGLILSGPRRYNLFTTFFFLGRQSRLLNGIVSHSGLREGEDALDIGCGPGTLVRVLGRRVGPRGSATGVDPSAVAIAHNRRHDPHNRYLRSTAQELALPDAAFDVVTCTFVMHHIPERYRRAALAEMWRVLRPGGRLVLADAYPSGLLRAVFTRSNRIRRKGSADPFVAVDIRRYSPVLRELGFTEPEFIADLPNTGLLISVRHEEP